MTRFLQWVALSVCISALFLLAYWVGVLLAGGPI